MTSGSGNSALRYGWLLCWLATVAAGLALRPPLPVDETRYLAVAWSMWLDGDFLVPHLNGEAYHHKPPLLFWLMNAFWALSGVNDWAPRLVAPLFALAALFLTRTLARELWPDGDAAADLAPTLLAGALFWTLFGTLTMFDMLLAACALAGLLGLVRAWRGGGRRAWLLVTLGIGIGVLAKGPAILLHILPAALLAPLWGPRLAWAPSPPAAGWGRWYGAVLLSVLGGAAIGLAWAVPAGIHGGEEYRNMIFWGQSAGRIVESFDHARPFWWYAAVLPPLLLPWTIWPALWRGLAGNVQRRDGALQFLLAWTVPAFVVFSAISGKQLHYLLPEFPALAILFARALGGSGKASFKVPALFFLMLGLAWASLAIFAPPFDAPDWFADLAPAWGGLIIAAGVGLFLLRTAAVGNIVLAGMAASGILVVALHLTAAKPLTVAYDLRPLAQHLKTLEDKGMGLANFGTYHGQYHFLGRLRKPIFEAGLQQVDTDAFIRANPGGAIVTYYDNPPAGPAGIEPLGRYRLKDFTVLIWPVRAFEIDPRIGDRR